MKYTKVSLMASAPEMYEVLREIVREWKEGNEFERHAQSIIKAADILKKIGDYNLTAAAPDLLEAAKNSISIGSCWYGAEQECGGQCGFCQLKNAIKKAEGG